MSLTRQEYYKVMDQANAFNERLERLEKTASILEKYFAEEFKAQDEREAQIFASIQAASETPEVDTEYPNPRGCS